MSVIQKKRVIGIDESELWALIEYHRKLSKYTRVRPGTAQEHAKRANHLTNLSLRWYSKLAWPS